MIGDDGFRGTVIKIATKGIRVDADACSGAMIHVQAGEDWDTVVQRAIAEEWSGLESMSGIPGLTGSTPVQNVGAYGHEVAETIASVRVWDRVESKIRTIFAADCGFAYRTSTLQGPTPEPVRRTGGRLPAEARQPLRPDRVRRTGPRPRRRPRRPRPDDRRPRGRPRHCAAARAWSWTPADHDTWSAGSFFTNPLLATPAEVPAGAPQWPQPDGRIKTSAAWLIEHAGIPKGFTIGHAAVSTKHTLALTNRGTATAKDLLSLATHVATQVHHAFAITLVNEPVLVNCTL